MRNLITTLCGFAVYIASPYIWNSSRALAWINSHAMRIALAFIALCAIGFSLSGCVPSLAPHSGAANAFIDQTISNGIDDMKQANDRVASVISNANCLPSVGAFSRLGSIDQQIGVMFSCPEFLATMRALAPYIVQLPTVGGLIAQPPAPSGFGPDKATPNPAATAANPSPTVAP